MTPKMPADRLAAAVVAVLVAAAAARADSVVLPSVRDNTLIQNASGSLSNGAGAHFHVGLTEQPARRSTGYGAGVDRSGSCFHAVYYPILQLDAAGYHRAG